MCKRNSPHKNKVSNGCVRETPQTKKTTTTKQQQHGMCKRNFPQKINQSWVVKEKLPPPPPPKNKTGTGCVRETPQI